MCNGILNDPRVLCQPFFAEFIKKHIFRVLSPNQPLYQELNMRWDERYNMHRKTFTFIPTCIPIRLKDGTQEFLPTAHRRGDLQFFMKYKHFGKSLVASALTCPHLRQFKTTKAFILATKCLGKWEKVGTLFQPANFSSNGALGTTWQACQCPNMVQTDPKWSQMANTTCFWPFGTI